MIREAEEKDRDQIQKLYMELCPDAPVKVLPERIKEIGNNENNFLFIYEENEVIIGTVFFSLCMGPMFGFQPFGIVEYSSNSPLELY